MGYFSPLIAFPRFIYLEPSFKAEEFNIAFRVEMYYFYSYEPRDDRMCWSVYTGIDEIEVLFQNIMRFQNCYKILIQCFYDYEIWTGEDALFIDKCSQSTKTEINMLDDSYGPFEIEILGSPYEDVLRANLDDTTVCTPGYINPLIQSYIPSDFHNIFAFNLFRYTTSAINRGTQNLAFYEN
jgi:hypothetical protein